MQDEIKFMAYIPSLKKRVYSDEFSSSSICVTLSKFFSTCAAYEGEDGFYIAQYRDQRIEPIE